MANHVAVLSNSELDAVTGGHEVRLSIFGYSFAIKTTDTNHGPTTCITVGTPEVTESVCYPPR